MKQYINQGITYKNCDCMELMASFKDKSIDLAIVDPPYFDGPNKRQFYGSKAGGLGGRKDYGTIEQWEPPTAEYFKELFRVSKHQIIWGVNYFTETYNFGPGRIIWDKCNGKSSFSDCEIAYTSLHDSVRMFKFMWSGMMQGKSITEGHIMQGNKALNEVRIHPTQKPVALYKWQLINYAQEGWIILDTHVGSGSILIACDDMGYEILGSELDEKVFNDSFERIRKHQNQVRFNI